VRTSPFRSTAYSLRCKTKKFEAILFSRRSHRRCLRTADTKTNTLGPNTCVNLEVLKTTTNNNTNIYHPNMTVGDDVCLLRVSFNSTLESLPLQFCSQPLTSNSFVIDRLGNLPGRSCALDLIPCFFYKKAPTPIGPPHFKLLPSSLVDLDLAIWFLLLIK
jgi:hypothetical protein